MTKICERPKRWSTFPCSMWFQTNAKVNVFCVNCEYPDERDWSGKIVGKGIHGCLNALFTRLKQNNTPLIGLLTLCSERCEEGLSYADYWARIEIILGSKHLSKNLGRMVLSLSSKEVEEVVFSKEIVMEGILMDSIETVGINGEQETWDLLKPLFKD